MDTMSIKIKHYNDGVLLLFFDVEACCTSDADMTINGTSSFIEFSGDLM